MLFDEATTERRAALADEALASARRLGDPSLIVFVLEHRLWLFGGPTHLAQRSTEIAELLRLLDAGGVPTAGGSRSSLPRAKRSNSSDGSRRAGQPRSAAPARRPAAQPAADARSADHWLELLAGRLAAAEECVRSARHAMDTKAVADMRANNTRN